MLCFICGLSEATQNFKTDRGQTQSICQTCEYKLNVSNED